MRTSLMHRLTIPAAIVVAALTLTGCSSSDDSGGDAKKATTEESPVQKYLSVLWGGEEYYEETRAKQQAEVEELIAVCMAKEGFEYTPNPEGDGMGIDLSEGMNSGPERGSLEYAETYGYGTVDWPGKDEEEVAMRRGEAEATVDPNQAYVESLSESEQRAYNETLMGDGSGGYSEEDPTVYDWTRTGCAGAAGHEVQPPGLGVYDDPEFKDVFAKLDEIYIATSGTGENPASNEAKAKLDRKWVECMADAGYDYNEVYGPMGEFGEEWSQIVNSIFSDENGEYREPSAADLEKRDKKEKKFQEEEIKVAVVDATCREKINYAKEETRIIHELERKLIEENKVQFEAMLAKYSMKKKSK